MKRAFHFILLIVFLSACGSQSKSTSVGCDTSKQGKKKIKPNKGCSKKEYCQLVLTLKIKSDV